MRTRRQQALEDAQTISQRNTRPKTSLDGGENSFPIPLDLCDEIFSRLPARSIATCRCVSKFWASMLRRQDFTEMFLRRSSARPQLLFAYQSQGEFAFFSSPQPQNPDEKSSPVVPNYHMKFPFDGSCEIGGLVHGLVCLTITKRNSKGNKETVPVICNLSTGQSLSLPKVRTRRVKVRSFFGYDPIEKQFKVLSMTFPFSGRQMVELTGSKMMSEEHQVLTLGAAGKLSWRIIDCSIFHYPVCEATGICIDGGLYYYADFDNFADHFAAIVCFDVRSEKFRIIKKGQGMLMWHYPTLVNYKGKLGTLELGGYTAEARCIELWVLVDPKKHELLKRLFELPSSWKNVLAKVRMYFVGVTGSEEIVVYFKPSLFCLFFYNLEKKTFRRVEMPGMDASVDIFLDHVEDVKLMQMFRT